MRHRTTRIQAVLAALWLLVLAPAAGAAVEAGDAGELPASAQDLRGAPVERVEGTLADSTDVDMYRLCLDGGGAFSASTVGGTAVDTRLFLFDASGRGVYANDDERDDVLQSLLPAGHPLTPRAQGEYLLAVAAYTRDPLGSGQAIFPGDTGVVGPTGPDGSDPVAGWGGRPGTPGAYTVTLTGTRCAPGEDTTPPAIDLGSPLDGAVYLLDEEVPAAYGCADDPGGSGVVACGGPVPDGALVDTSSVGPHEFTVTATDGAGNAASATARYRVIYDFEGFLGELDNRPAVNVRPAGVTVRVWFDLGGEHGRDVIAAGWPQVVETDCSFSEEPEGGAPAAHPAWFRDLAYRRRKGQYLFMWKTDRRWAGTCRQFMLKLDDGTVRRADFEFVRRSPGDADGDDGPVGDV